MRELSQVESAAVAYRDAVLLKRKMEAESYRLVWSNVDSKDPKVLLGRTLENAACDYGIAVNAARDELFEAITVLEQGGD